MCQKCFSTISCDLLAGLCVICRQAGKQINRKPVRLLVGFKYAKPGFLSDTIGLRDHAKEWQNHIVD